MENYWRLFTRYSLLASVRVVRVFPPHKTHADVPLDRERRRKKFNQSRPCVPFNLRNFPRSLRSRVFALRRKNLISTMYKVLRRCAVLMRFAAGFALILSALFMSILASSADIMLDDFNVSRPYPIVGGLFGVYDSFTNGVVQDGNGTLTVNTPLTEGGGLYHDGLTNNLWSFYGETGLVVRAKALTNNTAGKFFVVFQDYLERQILFEFPFSSLNATGFVTLERDLTEPDFYDAGFNVYEIQSMDIHADYQDASGPIFGLELDYVQTLGPLNVYSAPPLTIVLSGTNAVLKWPTNSPAGIFLQRSTNLNNLWLSNAGTPTVSGTNYSVTVPMTGQASFFQLGNTLSTAKKFKFASTNGGTLPPGWQTNSAKEWQSLAPPPLPPVYSQPTIDISRHTESYYTEFNVDEYEFGGAEGNTHDGGYLWRNGTTVGGIAETNPLQSLELRRAKFSLSGEGDECFGPNGGGTTYFTREIQTKLELHTPTNNSRFNLLRASARTVVLQNTICTAGPFVEVHHYPYDQHLEAFYDVAWTNNPCTNITPSLISIGSYFADADGNVFLPHLKSSFTYDVTPAVSGVNDYSFNVTVGTHKIEPLTWSYHQQFHVNTNGPPLVPKLSDWQSKFDAGSELLATDHDAKIPLNDPSVIETNTSGSVYRSDDVPTYVEFNLSEGPTNYCQYTRRIWPAVFPHPTFSSSNYFQIRFVTDLETLVASGGANLKIVKDIKIPQGGLDGYENHFTKPTSIVLAESAPADTCVHEWGHSCGLRHRGELDVITGVVMNPGPVSDAIMRSGFSMGYTNARTKVNRFERKMMIGE